MRKGVAVNRVGWRPILVKVAKSFGVVVLLVPSVAIALDFAEAEKLIKSYDPATRTYLYERLAAESSDQSEAKRACDDLPGGGVTQILRINQEGTIDLVVSNVATRQSECFEKLYLGRTFKAPPSAPVYIKHKVGYGSTSK